jgi:hypothetical protein
MLRLAGTLVVEFLLGITIRYVPCHDVVIRLASDEVEEEAGCHTTLERYGYWRGG